jgi:heat-inducible transcriptional repressor
MVDLEEVLRGTTRLLSHMTQYAAVAVPPAAGEEGIVKAEVIDLGSALMVLVVGQHGRVDKQIIDRPGSLDAAALSAVERRMRSLGGHSLPDARARVLKLAGESPGDERSVLLAIAGVLGDMQAGARADHVLVGGVANLADEAARWRQETARRLFEALERESEMLRLLRDVAADDLSVTIGTEHPATGEWDAALVAAPFGGADASLGAIGVVGPTRMDYLTVMSSVRAVARRLSELAAELDQ